MPSGGTRTQDVAADAADGHHPTHPFGMSDGEVERDTAAHRVADDVDGVQAERIDEAHQRIQCGDHRVAAEIVTDAEAGKLQDQTPEEFGERAQHAAEVAPARHAGAGAVQQQQWWPVGQAGFVIAQNACVGGDFAQGVFVGHVGGHACVPPSIRISVPVMNAPSSDTNIAMTPATAAGRPSRRHWIPAWSA